MTAYPFDDREFAHRAYQESKRYREALFGDLCVVLNEIHQVNLPERFWDITIGYWFQEFVEMFLERYISIVEVQRQHSPRGVTVTRVEDYVTPNDTSDFDSLSKEDWFNQQVYSQIIESLGTIPAFPRAMDRPTGHTARPFRALLKKFGGWASLLASKRSRFFLTSTYLPAPTLLAVGARLRSVPCFVLPTLSPPEPRRRDATLRRRLGEIVGFDEFSRALVSALPVQVPSVYVENFRALRRTASRLFPPRPRLIMTGNAFASNEAFKVWAADHASGGVPYVILQHGGHYGMGKWNGSEEYEIRVSDSYLTYGWDVPGNDKVKAFFGAKARRPARRLHNPQHPVLWVLASYPRYAYNMYSVPIGPQTLDYLDDQCRFIQALSPEGRQRILCRPYMHRYGWDDIRYIESRVGPLNKSSRESLARQLEQCRLYVATYNGTTLLEAIANDVPTVAYWNPHHWELREAARPYFDALEEVGVFFSRPEDAAAAVDEVSGNPAAWWARRQVRNAVAEFRHAFARATPDPVSAWTSVAEELAAESAVHGA